MFPIRDHNPSTRTPYVTWALVALNVAVFLLMLPFYRNEDQLWTIYDHYALVPLRITSGYGWDTLITSMFMHGGFWHLAGNMLFLWIFGDNLEDQMGHVPYLAFYLACGIGADLAQIMADPYSRIPQVGASGAIAGVMGGYLLLFPRARVDMLLFIVIFIRIFTVRAWLTLAVWFVIQLVAGIGSDAASSGVAHWAHIGGFLLGMVLTLPLWLRRGGPAFWERTAGRPPHPPATYRQTTIPTVRRR